MAETGNPQSPPVLRGAFVQLTETLGVPVPGIVPFQYNPAKLTRSVTPWNPFEVDQTNRGAQAPTVQPYDPEETFGLTLELDATDDLEDGEPVTVATGIASRIAALRKLTEPTEGTFGDLLASARALVGLGVDEETHRATVPITLLVLGPGLILPVRITSISIEVTEFMPTLYPRMAEVALEMRVLTPEVFKCRNSLAIDLAVAAYRFTRVQEDALGVARLASAVGSMQGMLPF